VGLLLLCITSHACCVLRGHTRGISILYPHVLWRDASLHQTPKEFLHQSATLLLRHLLIVVFMRLLHHLRRCILHKLSVVLVRFLVGDLSIGALIPVVGILLIHLLVVLIKWPHSFSFQYRVETETDLATSELILIRIIQ